MKIRVKLTALPIIAFLLPLVGGIFYVRSTARSYYEKQVGILYLTIAQDMEDALDRNVMGQMHNLENWIGMFDVAARMESGGQVPFDLDAVLEMESRWTTLTPDDEPLKSILNNPLADLLLRFQQLNPLFAEVMLTDRSGRLIAATNPTSDYWQADEAWWVNAAEGMDMEPGWSHSIIYDASAGVQAMDIAMPVRNGDGDFLGVVKGSLDAMEVLRRLAPDPWNTEISRDILFQDGRLFARLNMGSGSAELPERVSEEAFKRLTEGGVECRKADLFPGTSSLAVCLPVGVDDAEIYGNPTGPLIYVLVHREYASAMAPVSRVIRELTWQGSVLMMVIAVLSYLISTTWLSRPLGRLRKAAMSLGEHVQLQKQGRSDELYDSLREVEISLTQLKAIRTRDEIQELAQVFTLMGGRVLNFHRQMERELVRATEEINEDLIMAREFQEALLPDQYPQIPEPAGSEAYTLRFRHIYRPAQSVSGDFFDISAISKHTARIVVADVMGHGARSALMTAILHALIADTPKDDDSPEPLLQRMNEEFYAIGQRTGDMVFVTAVHLIIDTRRREIRYALAGHPSPLVLDHASGRVYPLVSDDATTPAAGLIGDTLYSGSEYRLEKPQTLLLYTDGVTEARNPGGQEFGLTRLMQLAADYLADGGTGSLPAFVLEHLETFMDAAVAGDDICMVSIDINDARTK